MLVLGVVYLLHGYTTMAVAFWEPLMTAKLKSPVYARARRVPTTDLDRFFFTFGPVLFGMGFLDFYY